MLLSLHVVLLKYFLYLSLSVLSNFKDSYRKYTVIVVLLSIYLYKVEYIQYTQLHIYRMFKNHSSAEAPEPKLLSIIFVCIYHFLSFSY